MSTETPTRKQYNYFATLDAPHASEPIATADLLIYDIGRGPKRVKHTAGRDPTSDTNLFLPPLVQLHVLAALAEFERERIRERVHAGLARARVWGVSKTTAAGGLQQVTTCDEGADGGDARELLAPSHSRAERLLGSDSAVWEGPDQAPRSER
jgi:hypothetical protein